MNENQSPGDGTPNENRGESASSGNSLSRQPEALQPGQSDPPHGQLVPDAHDNDPRHDPCATTSIGEHTAHVVLYQPEIPQNTGNIGRTCVAVGAKLWIVRPAAFRIDDARLRRAGLDYWQHLSLGDAVNWEDLVEQLAPRRMFFLSRFAKRTIWDAEFRQGDVFVFGRETSGLPESILDPEDPRSLRLPTSEQIRSLNLATTVGIVLYEHQRQTR